MRINHASSHYSQKNDEAAAVWLMILILLSTTAYAIFGLLQKLAG